MKLLLLSAALGFVFVVFYLSVVSIIFAVSNYDVSLIPYINLPVRLPQVVYYYFYPPIAEDYSMEFSQRRAIMGVVFFIVNVLLYSILFYFVLKLLSKFRKPKQTPTNEPPSPPSF